MKPRRRKHGTPMPEMNDAQVNAFVRLAFLVFVLTVLISLLFSILGTHS